MVRIWKFITLFLELFGTHRTLDKRRIEKRGLLAVKIAQMYAVRSDILGVEKCRQLQELYESVHPIAWEEVKKVIDEQAPEGFWAQIAQIDTHPLATGSLGQVHKGVLCSKEEVVVKVVKPGVLEAFEKDLRAARRMLRTVLFFYPKLRRLADPLGTLETVERLTRREFDLRHEQEGTNRLIALLGEGERLDHLRKLHFPRIYSHLGSSAVSVSAYLPMPSVAKGLETGSFQYEQLLQLFRIQGYFLFLKGEFHGDFHPGNILSDGTDFWLIDNANVERVDPLFTRGLLQFLNSLGEKKYEQAARIIESLALEPLRDNRVFVRRFLALYADFENTTSSLTRQMMESVKLCVQAGLEFPEGAFPVIKCLMYLDGMALQCAPEAPLLADVIRFSSDFETKG